MPYLKNKFFAELSPLADIVEFSTDSFEELEGDFKTKYAGVKVIYHLRDPGSPFGSLKDDFLRSVPSSCEVICHCKRDWPIHMYD